VLLRRYAVWNNVIANPIQFCNGWFTYKFHMLGKNWREICMILRTVLVYLLFCCCCYRCSPVYSQNMLICWLQPFSSAGWFLWKHDENMIIIFCRFCRVLSPFTATSDYTGSRAVSFKRPLLSVDVSVCVSATSMLNIPETKRFWGLCPIGSL